MMLSGNIIPFFGEWPDPSGLIKATDLSFFPILYMNG